MYHCQPVLCEFMSCLYYYDDPAASTTKSDPENGDCHSSMMLFQLPLLTKREVWAIFLWLFHASDWSPPWQRTVFPATWAFAWFLQKKFFLSSKKKSKKSGYLIDLAEPPNKPSWGWNNAILGLVRLSLIIHPKAHIPFLNISKSGRRRHDSWSFDSISNLRDHPPLGSRGLLLGQGATFIHVRLKHVKLFKLFTEKKDPNVWRSKGSKGFPKVAKFRYSQWNVSTYAMSEWYENA